MFKSKILVIGSSPHKGVSKTYGGTTVLMQNFLNFLDINQFKEFKFIQSNKFNFKGAQFFNTIYLLSKTIVILPFCSKVMFNAASNGAFIIAPLIFFYSKLFGKKFIFRMFGGNLIDLIKSKPRFLVYLFFKSVIKSDLIFVETKILVSYLSNYNSNVFWFPNVREKSEIKKNKKEYSKKFVFISHVKKSKGVIEIIEAFKELDNTFLVDLYGPLKDNVLEDIKLPPNVDYKGVLRPDEVTVKLNEYDVLLLPTYHEGEGYPGIILEAFSLGIPVISTIWKSIPEIVNNDLGILINPKNIPELKDAILYFDSENYLKFSLCAEKHFQQFDSSFVNQNIINKITNI